VSVELWARELGEVLGYSVHLRYDAEHLTIDETAIAPTAEWSSALDPNQEGAVRALVTSKPGELAAGATRSSA
jgi:hypothetical protein